MKPTRSRRVLALCAATLTIAAACGGSDSSTSTDTDIQDEIVVSQDQVDAALAERDAEADTAVATEEPELASATESDLATTDDDATEAETDEIDVAEAEEDELDTLLNSLNVFNDCLAESGFELDGFPGDDTGRTADEFEQDYLTALVTCNTASGITDALTSFGEANQNRTPEEIEQFNFGTPTFKECLEDLGWEVGELIPDERGTLGFGETGFDFTPPGGDSISDFNTDDINACRLEAEQFVADNFDAEDG